MFSVVSLTERCSLSPIGSVNDSILAVTLGVSLKKRVKYSKTNI